ncbi:uncharacterized protein BJ212DRAFT_198479 [Suillus subaureus]|uniref:Uncharacterized protein n=1 Tax=Suillus subaureus TaxID=48587 RepID=A0A9P7DMX7_9AGAM|nr:uncharacterized protein BJ212DRAFT_198479 [Suillus subaureus]KAG1798774.1 hypothetical protein BJ212DRAFT_198479 [Suillus subaureus]
MERVFIRSYSSALSIYSKSPPCKLLIGYFHRSISNSRRAFSCSLKRNSPPLMYSLVVFHRGGLWRYPSACITVISNLLFLLWDIMLSYESESHFTVDADVLKFCAHLSVAAWYAFIMFVLYSVSSPHPSVPAATNIHEILEDSTG